MKTFNKSVVLNAVLVAALALVAAPRAAAQMGSISGQILDINAKPWVGLTVQAVSEQGAKETAKTDNDGKYNIPNLRAGIYMVTIAVFPPPNDKQPPYDMAKVRVTCSPRTGPGGMRVSVAPRGRETNREATHG